MPLLTWLTGVLAATCGVGLCEPDETPDSRAAPRDESVVVSFDLTTADEVRRWQGRHDLSAVAATPDGMRLSISGPDPYLSGPPRNYPADKPLQLLLRLRSDEAGIAQVFYFAQHAEEAHSVRIPVKGGGRLTEASVPLPPLGNNFRLRFDPPGQRGACLVERLEVRRREQIAWPAWPAPEISADGPDRRRVAAGQLELHHAPGRWGDFSVTWRGQRVATGHDRPLIGYLDATGPIWLDLQRRARVETYLTDGVLRVVATFRDEQNVGWRLEQFFAAGRPGTVNITTEVHVERDRDVLLLPTLLVLPGHGTHGPRKNQALAAGFEYLDDEPSSSEADIEGPGSIRRTPSAEKVTFPLLVVQHDDHYVGLSWHVQADAAPWFDSPDRLLGTPAHVLGIVAPGNAEGQHDDGLPLAKLPLRIQPDRPIRHAATLLVGDGRSVVPALQAYVAQRGLPELPPAPSRQTYVDETARAWLDTEIRQGGRFRHAVGGDFGAAPALDAAWMLHWLGDQADDPLHADRLHQLAVQVAAEVPVGQEYFSHVGHVRPPVAGSVFGRLDATIEQARAAGRGQLNRFDPDGVARYHVPPTGIDYSRTLPSREASGLAADPVAALLEAAAYSHDRQLLAVGLERLADLRRFDLRVPRGAQTWEIPLHTPDILAAAHLVRAYTWGYRLTGEPKWLEQAIYWAWTGVPFVYLHHPVAHDSERDVGPYATIAVYGATQWKSPNWMGLPVQWCGLVYADAIRGLARFDPAGPWRQIALGITHSAWQQVYPPDHPRHGLLPDSFQLTVQARNPADINPGTLQPLAMWALTDVAAWDFVSLPTTGVAVHAAGNVRKVNDQVRRATVEVQPWRRAPTQVAVLGLTARPRVTLAGQPVPDDDRRLRFLAKSGTLLVELEGAGRPIQLDIQWD